VKRLRKIHEPELVVVGALIEGHVSKAEGATFTFL